MNVFLNVVIFVSLFDFSSAVRVKDIIYVPLVDSEYACFRLLNGTHQTGCQSDRSGSTGVVHLIQTDNDVQFVLNDPGGNAPFAVAMRLNYFNKQLLLQLRDSGKVVGVLLLHNVKDSSTATGFSEDYSCPNDINSLYADDSADSHCKKTVWNQIGNQMRFIDWNIPIFLMQNETEIEYIEKYCYNETNQPINSKPRSWPLCAVEMMMFNQAAGSTTTCMRRNSLFNSLDGSSKICDPLEDDNIYGFVPATNKSTGLNESSVIVLAARMDSFSMFAQSDPGAASALSNVIAILAVAQAIGRNMATFKDISVASGRRVLFALFNGEAFDYIGSSRMVWDISRGQFPTPLNPTIVNQSALLNLSHIDLFIELNQLAPADATQITPQYYLHTDPSSITNAVKTANDNLVKYSSGLIGGADYNAPLPPSSVQMFMKQGNVSGIVITNHQTNYTNKFYNSFLDTPLKFDVDKSATAIAKLSNVVVQFVVERISNDRKIAQQFTVNETFVRTVADCFWQWPAWNCSVIDKIIDSLSSEQKQNSFRTAINDYPYQRTYSSIKLSRVRYFTSYMMRYVLGDRLDWTNKSRDACKETTFAQTSDDIHSYDYMKDIFNSNSNVSYCVVSTVQTSTAKSPAFEIDGYDYTKSDYSTWTESIWLTPRLRMFMKASPTWEGGVFGFGLSVFLFCLLSVYAVNRGSQTLFASNVVAL